MVNESGIEWQKSMVLGAYKHGRYEKIGLKSLYAMFSLNVFAMQSGQPAGWPTKYD